LGWRPGPGKGAKNAQTCSHCDVTHKEPKIQVEKFFLRSQIEDLRNL